MCGIAGVLNRKSDLVSRRTLQKMIGALGHRGPDDEGTYLHGPVGLAHKRLSIVDLTTGHQPMSNEDGSIWITFNGEIFNFLELRRELERSGHRFSTKSDTEVIVHSYEEKGPDCVSDFNGQWAFALWDARKRRLFLSRDRMGIRPLYYAKLPESFVFGSEIKALLHHPGTGRDVDAKAIDEIFTIWGTVAPRTALRSVRELPPGHSMLVTEVDVKIWNHWQLDISEADSPVSEEEAEERLLELLIDSTRLRLRADVPVGAYLSGGLDSAITCALAKRYTSTPLETFSITFDDPDFDESAYQKEMVRDLGVHHETVTCSPDDIGKVFPHIIRHTEQPVLRTAPAPLYLLSELVNSLDYKVVVTGEGADEVLGGYDIFKETKIRRFWAKDPKSRLRPLLLKRLYPYLNDLQSQSREYLQAFFQIRPTDLESCFFSHLPRWRLTSHLKLFLSKQLRAEVGEYNSMDAIERTLPPEFHSWASFAKAQYLESTLLLPGYILSSQGDRMAMAHSVEGRFPFLDHRVVEFAAGLPAKLKMRGLCEKYLLKEAAKDFIPGSIRKRPKQPYRAPEAASFFDFESGKARFEYVEEMLSNSVLSRFGLFEPEAVRKLVAKVRYGGATSIRDNMALVGILSSQLFVAWLDSER